MNKLSISQCLQWVALIELISQCPGKLLVILIVAVDQTLDVLWTESAVDNGNQAPQFGL